MICLSRDAVIPGMGMVTYLRQNEAPDHRGGRGLGVLGMAVKPWVM